MSENIEGIEKEWLEEWHTSMAALRALRDKMRGCPSSRNDLLKVGEVLRIMHSMYR
jgi:hypothetical protein